MRAITLPEILRARDIRAASQRRLLAAYEAPLLSLTMNLAGPVKRSALADFAFWDILPVLRQRLGTDVIHMELRDAATGLEALLVCRCPAATLKALALDLEEKQEIGRLYDLDVLDRNGQKLSRPSPRPCLVCGGPASVCARSRAHGLPAVQAAADALLRNFAVDRLADLAVEALLEEAALTPKPGLVDCRSSGAHSDMDFLLLCQSARCLGPYFRQAAALGLTAADCMAPLQQAGQAAEQTMLAATGGVNTHKGAVYAFGLVLAAAGSRLARGGDILTAAAALARAGVPPESGSTHGSRIQARYGAAGARGEAQAGFPHARMAWAVLTRQGPFQALLTLLAEVEDTNLLHRGGQEGLRFVQAQAREILAGPAAEYENRLAELDLACRKRNLSPGGCADLLALALLLEKLETYRLFP